MKIRVYAVAFDGDNMGISAECFATKREAYEYLVDLLTDEEPPNKLVALLDAEEWDKIVVLLSDRYAEARSATWQIYPAEFDVDELERVREQPRREDDNEPRDHNDADGVQTMRDQG